MPACFRFIILSCLCAGFFAHGQSSSSFCSPKDSAIFFGNGVLTTRTAAERNLLALEDGVRTVMSATDYEKVEFALAYNTTGGVLDDLLESVIQDLSTDSTLFWRTVASIVPMPTSFRDELLHLAAAVDEAALASNQDVATHVTSYKNKILEGKTVTLVSHSQGNFFANQAYGNLTGTERLSFGIASAANPDSSVAGGGPYTTLVEDLVILAIRVAKQEASLPTPLPANVTNFLTLDDLTGHGFVEAYLAASSNSRGQVLANVVSVKNALVRPSGPAGQGIITVTLTWGAQPDVDLHAFEPNGTHVFYGNRFGLSGYLDVDDVTSFGPEHYFVGCSTLETGTYRIGVNYYYGNAPEVANVLMQAGLESKGVSAYLPAALGSAGNGSPVPVGSIVVTGNSTDGFKFQIQ